MAVLETKYSDHQYFSMMAPFADNSPGHELWLRYKEDALLDQQRRREGAAAIYRLPTYTNDVIAVAQQMGAQASAREDLIMKEFGEYREKMEQSVAHTQQMLVGSHQQIMIAQQQLFHRQQQMAQGHQQLPPYHDPLSSSSSVGMLSTLPFLNDYQRQPLGTLAPGLGGRQNGVQAGGSSQQGQGGSNNSSSKSKEIPLEEVYKVFQLQWRKEIGYSGGRK